ncbi:TonB-dependent receptor family protein [Microbulbifer epialgicus]|uniref:TonB-dependent receptor family protein n=1 Tax=Microbulbifer epialgicus TaxID=393907 RepID=A0ABV4P2I6_9GAMM
MSYHQRLGRRTSLAIAIFSALHVSASLAEEGAAVDMEEVTVTGSLLGQSSLEEIKSYAGNRSILTAEMLEKSASLSIDAALQQVPGIKVQDETGTGVLPNVAVRGLSASRSGYTQFLVDGVPLTLAPYGHTGQSLFPATLKSLDRIDIVRGGAAVQYGPNNVGGVINLVTKPIAEDWQTSLEEKVTFFSGGNHLTDTYLRTGGQVNESFALQLEGNIVKGESFRDHSDTDVQNWILKSRWDIDAEQSLGVTLQQYDAETDMPGALHTEAFEQDRTQSLRPNDEFSGDTTRATVQYNRQFDSLGAADGGEFNWTTFGHNSSRNFQWDFTTDPSADHWADTRAPATHLRSSPREFKVWGTEPRMALQFNGEDVNHKLTAGARLVKEDIDYQLGQVLLSTNTESIPRDWHLETSAVAIYLSDEIQLLDQRLTISPGIRYENVDMTFQDLIAGTETDNSLTEVLPGLTVGYQAGDNWFVYSNAQRSLRVPQIAVIRGVGEEGAELAWNYEAGLRYTLGDSVSLNTSLYRIDFKDQLLYNSFEQSFDNIGETRHQGIEIEGSLTPQSLTNLTLNVAYNYLDSEQREGVNTGNELPYASKHQIHWDASYAFDSVDATLSGFYYSSAFSDQSNAEEENAAGTTGELPSYMVWNLQISKTTELSGDGTLYTALSVNNLFDKEYYFRGIDVSPAGRYPAPSRSISAEVRYTF